MDVIHEDKLKASVLSTKHACKFPKKVLQFNNYKFVRKLLNRRLQNQVYQVTYQQTKSISKSIDTHGS